MTRRPSRLPRLEPLEDRAVPAFAAGVTYPADTPTHLVVGDFRGIGRPDLATSNYGQPPTTVLLNDGHGNFQPVHVGTPDVYNQGVAVADFNRDGKDDLAVSNFGDGRVRIFLSRGDGTFIQAPTLSGTNSPQSAAAADLNGDRKIDLVTADASSSTLSVFLGRGDGTFGPRREFEQGGGSNSVTIADFFGDGRPSLAVSNGAVDAVSILRGNGDGTFRPPVSYPLDRPLNSDAADLDGDGDVDLAVPSTTGVVGVFLNRGDGTFESSTYAAGPGSHGVAIADLNRDGLPDLATANQNDATVSVLLNAGGGTFAAPVHVPAGDGSNDIVAADLDGDGWADLATANFYSSTVTVLRNDRQWPRTGSLVAEVEGVATAGQVVRITVTARDADGNVDPGYTGTIRFKSSDPRALLPEEYTFTPDDAGTRVFEAVLYRAGAQTILATDGAFTGLEAGIVIRPGALKRVQIRGLPAAAVAGISRRFTVAGVDDYDNVVPGYRGTVRLTSSDPRARLPRPFTIRAADRGTRTFTAVLYSAGPRALTVTDVVRGWTGSGMLDVLPAAARRVQVIGLPGSAPVDEQVIFTVRLLDPFGNVATRFQGTVRITATDRAGRVTLLAQHTFTAADAGALPFSAVFRRRGLHRVDAFIPGTGLRGSDTIVVTA
jgi:hypothetical protein